MPAKSPLEGRVREDGQIADEAASRTVMPLDGEGLRDGRPVNKAISRGGRPANEAISRSGRPTNEAISRGGQPVIEVRSLVKRFREVTAVDGASFEVRRGEIFGLMGANGAGKTTIQRIMATILRPTSGSVQVNGYDVEREPEKVRASIGVITEETGLYDRLSARETLMFYGRLYGLGDDEAHRRSDEVITLLGMQDYADRWTEKLSKGMRQKIVIGRALVHDPPVLLFDEPTSGLDVLAARTVRDFIKKSRDMGKTVVYSTHIMFEAEDLCDRMVIIHKGRVVARGTVPEVKGGHRFLEDAFIERVRGGAVFKSAKRSANGSAKGGGGP